MKEYSLLGEKDSEWIGRNVALGRSGSAEEPLQVRYYELSDTTLFGCVIFISVMLFTLMASRIGDEQI